MQLIVETSTGITMEFIRNSGIGSLYRPHKAGRFNFTEQDRQQGFIYDPWAHEFLCAESGEPCPQLGVIEGVQ